MPKKGKKEKEKVIDIKEFIDTTRKDITKVIKVQESTGYRGGC